MLNYSDMVFEMKIDIITEACFPISEYTLYESSEPLQIKLWTAIQKFLKRMQELIQDSIMVARRKLKQQLTDKKTVDSLKRLRNELNANKTLGKKNTEFYDVWKYQKVMEKSTKELDGIVRRFLMKYEQVGAGLTSTNHFVHKVNSTIDKYESELKMIRSKKIQVPIQKVLDWIDYQMLKGNGHVFDFADEYLKKLDEYQKTVRTFESKADAYADKTGMVRKPTDITEVIKNISIYVKRNIDWIGPGVLAVALHLFSAGISAHAANKEFDSLNAKHPSRGSAEDTNRYNIEQLRAAATDNVEKGIIGAKGNKKNVVAKRVAQAGEVAAGAAAGKNVQKAMKDGRNSV